MSATRLRLTPAHLLPGRELTTTWNEFTGTLQGGREGGRERVREKEGRRERGREGGRGMEQSMTAIWQ